MSSSRPPNRVEPAAGSSRRWQRALITGGSAGIGAAFARCLAGQDTHLVLVARGSDQLDALSGEIRQRWRVDIEAYSADLTKSDHVTRIEERLLARAAPIDLLVNNAGGSQTFGPLIERDASSVEAEALLNAMAVLRLTHAAATAMTAGGHGNIINVSAGTAFYPVPGAATYAASKAFVNALSAAVDYELRRTAVRVTVICPGFTRTEAPARLGYTDEAIPRRLWLDPEQVARAALRGAARGRRMVTPGRANRINAVLGRHLPRALLLPMIARFGTPSGRHAIV